MEAHEIFEYETKFRQWYNAQRNKRDADFIDFVIWLYSSKDGRRFFDHVKEDMEEE